MKKVRKGMLQIDDSTTKMMQDIFEKFVKAKLLKYVLETL